MKTQEVTKKVTHYIANDGKDFGEDKAACELYEFENPYAKDMEKIPTIKNLLFFNERIDGYWCESQEDIDLCCHYFQECKRKENVLTKKRNSEMNYLDSLCTGRFIYPGYYFIIKFSSNNFDSYAMYSLSQMDNLWKVFLNQVPVNPDAYKRTEDLRKEFNDYIENNTKIENPVEDIDETKPNIVEKMFEKIKEEQKNNIGKESLKIYKPNNFNEYKSHKDKENKNE